jgi:hypothetical protein
VIRWVGLVLVLLASACAPEAPKDDFRRATIVVQSEELVSTFRSAAAYWGAATNGDVSFNVASGSSCDNEGACVVAGLNAGQLAPGQLGLTRCWSPTACAVIVMDGQSETDLLTSVAHELGHVLLQHDDRDHAPPGALMAAHAGAEQGHSCVGEFTAAEYSGKFGAPIEPGDCLN